MSNDLPCWLLRFGYRRTCSSNPIEQRDSIFVTLLRHAANIVTDGFQYAVAVRQQRSLGGRSLGGGALVGGGLAEEAGGDLDPGLAVLGAGGSSPRPTAIRLPVDSQGAPRFALGTSRGPNGIGPTFEKVILYS